MKTLLLDSSVYISSLSKKDIFHRETKEFTSLLKDEEIEIISPILVVLEVANILQKSAIRILSLFEESLVVDLNWNFGKQIIPFFKKVNLKTSDAIIVAVAKIYKAQLISWDKKLIRESKKLVQAYTPQEYLKKE